MKRLLINRKIFVLVVLLTIQCTLFSQITKPVETNTDLDSQIMDEIMTMIYPQIGDTAPTVVDLTGNVLEGKIVLVHSGLVLLYFSQMDYLGKEVAEDTLVVTPRYRKDHVVSRLLKQGKGLVYNRSTDSFVNRYTHRLEQYASMASRMFEYEDGDRFFMNSEIYGIMPQIVFRSISKKERDSMEQERKSIIPIKDFHYPEEFPDVHNRVEIRVRDYFPLSDRTGYVFKAVVNPYDYRDTSIVKKAILEDGDAYFFSDHQGPDYFSGMTNHNMIGWPGLYFYRGDTLFGIDVGWERDIKEYHETQAKAQVFLLPNMSTGDSLSHKAWMNEQVVTFLSLEDVVIGATTYVDCAKFKIIKSYDETIYLSYFWLCKNIGLVKRTYDTGKMIEFVETFDVQDMSND